MRTRIIAALSAGMLCLGTIMMSPQAAAELSEPDNTVVENSEEVSTDTTDSDQLAESSESTLDTSTDAESDGSVVGDTELADSSSETVADVTESDRSAEAELSATPALTIIMARTDSLASPVYEGDVVTYNISYTNNLTEKVTAFPKSGDFDGLLTNTNRNCRWQNLAPGDTKTCTTATHTITAADVERGYFDPTTVWKATRDRAGNNIIEDDISSQATSTIQVVAGERDGLPSDPATIPTDRVDGEAVRLAHGGENDFKCYRIPALTEAPNGWILAAWDGRPANCADAPQANSIVQRISKDGGKSWEPMEVIAKGFTGTNKYGYSDPSYVVDEETGKIFLFFVKSFDVNIWNSQAGTDANNRNIMHAAVMESTDYGQTWTEPKVITDQITKYGWKGRFAASGRGIQLKYGDKKGRLIQQYSVTGPNVQTLAAVSVYSDDHGVTWHAGEPAGGGMDENKVVELSDGRLMLNSRASDSVKARKIAYSDDGGETWGPVTVDYQLPDPHNNAQIIRAFPDAPQGSAQAKILLYSSSSASGRVNGLVRISFDDGKTWSAQKLFKAGSMAYSVIAPLKSAGGYGLLYEGDNNDIMYTHISLAWLDALPLTLDSESKAVRRGKRSVEVTLANMGETELSDISIEASAPTGWEVTNAHVESLGAESETILSLDVTVPAGADSGTVSIPVTITTGSKSATATLSLDVSVLDSEATSTVGVDLVSEPPAQSGTPISNIVDGKANTIWHSPWDGSAKLPIDIDLATSDETVERIVRIDLTGRSSGGNNGRFKTVEVYTGTSEDDLTLSTTATLVDSAEKQSIYLDEQASHVRLRVRETYGNPLNTYASLAEVDLRSAFLTAVDEPLVKHEYVLGTPLTRTDCYLTDDAEECAYEHGDALVSPEYVLGEPLTRTDCYLTDDAEECAYELGDPLVSPEYILGEPLTRTDCYLSDAGENCAYEHGDALVSPEYVLGEPLTRTDCYLTDDTEECAYELGDPLVSPEYVLGEPLTRTDCYLSDDAEECAYQLGDALYLDEEQDLADADSPASDDGKADVLRIRKQLPQTGSSAGSAVGMAVFGACALSFLIRRRIRP